MNLKEKALGILSTAKLYWNTPPLGKHMTYKEIIAYSGGGIGVYFIFTMVNNLMVTTTNAILASGIGIGYSHLYILYLTATIIGIPLTMLRAKMIDDSRHKKGKYRPFLVKMGIPTALLVIGYVWMPYEKWIEIGATADNPYGGGYILCCAIILLFNIGFQFFYNFFYDAYNSLIYVMSPNSQERTDAVAIKSVVYSLAPSILNAIIPILAKVISGGSMVDIKLYRFVYPPIALIGFMLSLIVYANVSEKIIQAKTHTIRVSFLDSLKAVARNKYFWIISLAGWIGFLEGAYGTILLWLYEYGHACSPGEYSLIQTVYGNASLWGMIAAPFAIKRFGKKKVIIATNVCNIAFILLMLPNVDKIYWVLLCLYMNALVGSFAHILDPSIQADIRDYQHYISGERIDGMFASISIIGTFVTMVTSGVLPKLYEAMGLSAKAYPELGKDYMQVLDINNGYMNAAGTTPLLYSILRVLILCSAIGACMNVVPYFFYNLSEEKHRGMVKVLKIRALFEDYGNGVLSDRDLVDAIDLVETAKEYATKEAVPADRKTIRQARKTKDKAAVAKAKQNFRDAVEHNAWVMDAPLILDEINRFDLSFAQKQLELVIPAYNGGYAALANFDKAELAAAKAMPKSTADEKELRRFAITHAKDKKAAAKVIKKHYPEGVVEFDIVVFDGLFKKAEELDTAITLATRELEHAKKAKAANIDELKAKVAQLKQEKAEIEKKIKLATKENTLFNRAAKPYIVAKKIVKQKENYSHFEEIAAGYEEAKRRAEEAEEAERLERERIAAEEEAFANKLKEEKKKAKAKK